MQVSKTAILTTVANFELYRKTSILFPEGVQKYIIDGRDGMHGIHSLVYMMHKLKNKGIHWLIMADEDVVFTDNKLVFSLIDKMNIEGITVCGVRDGGVVLHRKKNPFVINTFFSVINLKEVFNIWNKKEMLKNQYIEEGEFQDDLSGLKGDFDRKSLYEPYYCFYFWLRRQEKRFLFLESKMCSDMIANDVYYENKKLLCHTWYARSYGENKKHTDRINVILNANGVENNIETDFMDVIIYKKRWFYMQKLIRKYYKYLIMKLRK
ncbi:hypothetical protein Q4Q35_12130 [Flavivirga aquimarina]|uniref:Nucleotide-diphospho-sugar transferase domain-containing protein n=1 Tax=Flavivirga aquimarina TaxID=2027862 RepID=A0ABT8WBN6_9FLAO|nr:hypothetical protein [Flavivirga aquimarina]MDO5970555.1 hypothetical protein [Flavivirga aquimarina]